MDYMATAGLILMDELVKMKRMVTDADGENNLVVIHVDKAIGLVCQLVALCDVAVPGVTWIIMDRHGSSWIIMDHHGKWKCQQSI